MPNGAWKTGWRSVGLTRSDRILTHDVIDLSSRFGMAAFLATLDKPAALPGRCHSIQAPYLRQFMQETPQ